MLSSSRRSAIFHGFGPAEGVRCVFHSIETRLDEMVLTVAMEGNGLEKKHRLDKCN